MKSKSKVLNFNRIYRKKNMNLLVRHGALGAVKLEAVVHGELAHVDHQHVRGLGAVRDEDDRSARLDIQQNPR